MKKEPKQTELQEITAAARRGDKVQAISLYITATGAGLTEAQNFVRELSAREQDLSAQEMKKQPREGGGTR